VRRSEQGSIELLVIFSILLVISAFGMAVHWLYHLEDCFRWLDQLPNQQQAITQDYHRCFGKDWLSLPPEIDYGAAFQKYFDAPVLCYIEENLPEIGDFILCE